MSSSTTAGFSRRSFLTGLGLSAAALPWLPVLDTRAHAEIPQRIVLVFSPNGTIHHDWVPTGAETSFTLGPILVPLEPHIDDIVVIDGLHFPSGGAGSKHMAGPSKFSCGAGLQEGSEFSGGDSQSSGWGNGTSIDQEYAKIVGGITPFASLELGVRVKDADVRRRLAYAGPAQPIAPENDPHAVFDRLFGDFDQNDVEIERLEAERRSVLDVVMAQTETLQAKLSTDERHKMEAHLDGLREIEKRLDLQTGVGQSCALPQIGDALDFMQTENYEQVTKLHFDLLTMAFACDLTRAVTFMWSGSTSSQTFPWLGISDGHHDISHEGDSNTAAQQQLTSINTWYAQQFADFLAALKAIPEGDGTMLDNTIVLWGNELGKGNDHSHDNIPLVLAGGRNLGIVTGRFLQYQETEHNRLLVSLLNKLGIEADTWGDIDTGSGPLPGL